tara:strand:+ start:693 stop:848 length:156 start_codon:yes stop_codon:yes gene_type:complete
MEANIQKIREEYVSLGAQDESTPPTLMSGTTNNKGKKIHGMGRTTHSSYRE